MGWGKGVFWRGCGRRRRVVRLPGRARTRRAGRRRRRVREGRRGVFGVRWGRRRERTPPAPMRWSRYPPLARSRRRRFRGCRAGPTPAGIAAPTTCRPARPVGGIRRRGEGRGCNRRRRPRTVRTLGSRGRRRKRVVGGWGAGVGGRPASWRACRRASMAPSNGRVPASVAGDGGILGSQRRPRRRAGGRDGSGLRTH